MNSFKETIVAVVVGSNRGIGLALVQQLLTDSSVDIVYAGCRTISAAQGLNDAVKTYGDRLIPVSVDLTSTESVDAFRGFLEFEGAQPNLVINCAGILHNQDVKPEKRLEDIEIGSLRKYFDTNAIGPVLLAKALKNILPTRRRVVLGNLSAKLGSVGDNKLGGWYGYRASKTALNMFTRNIAIELGRRNKELVCVGLHPGTVDTRLSRPFQRKETAQSLLLPETSAGLLLNVLDQLTPEDSGGFFAYDGCRIPW